MSSPWLWGCYTSKKMLNTQPPAPRLDTGAVEPYEASLSLSRQTQVSSRDQTRRPQ